jgi:segregation and condensation protein A
MAQLLSGKFEGFDIFVRKPMEFKFSKRYTRHHDPLELSTVYCQLNQRPQEEKMRLLAEQRVKNVVSEKPVSVMSKVIYLLRQLFNNKVVYIDQLYDGLKDKSSRIAMFLAILELTRNGRIVISDDNTEIYLKQERKRKKSTESEVK